MKKPNVFKLITLNIGTYLNSKKPTNLDTDKFLPYTLWNFRNLEGVKLSIAQNSFCYDVHLYL